jgi:hypothetical protein
MTDFNATKSLRNAIYGVYYAITAALPPESAHVAHQILSGFLCEPDLAPEERLAVRKLQGVWVFHSARLRAWRSRARPLTAAALLQQSLSQ